MWHDELPVITMVTDLPHEIADVSRPPNQILSKTIIMEKKDPTRSLEKRRK